MSADKNTAAVVHLYQPGANPQQVELSLESFAGQGYRVLLRQGPAGTELKSMYKNSQPLPPAEAQALLQRTLAAKLDEGFLGAGSALPPPPALPPTPPSAAVQQLVATLSPANWRLLSARQRSRTVWRIGEMRLSAAVPRLVELLGSGDAMLDYCLAWAAGRCGDAGAAPAMAELARRGSTEPVRRIARLAALQLGTATARMSHAAAVVADWPAALRNAWSSRDRVAIASVIASASTWERQHHADWLEQLDEVAQGDALGRELLLGEVERLPLQAGNFRAMRRLYKAAEFRGDAELWALLQLRFERTQAAFRHGGLAQKIRLDGRYVRVGEELQSPDSRLAWSQRTRLYLLRRGWRTLRRLGCSDSPEFATMAFAALCAYDDALAAPDRVIEQHRWENRQWQTIRQYAHRHCQAVLFNRLLFRAGGPVKGSRSGNRWHADAPLPLEREQRFEPFAEQWNRRPDLLLRLALESRAERIHGFAVHALVESPAWLATLDDSLWRRLLNSPFAVTAEFAWKQLQARISAEVEQERREAWLALLLGSRHPTIHNAALGLLEQNPAAWAGSALLIQAVLVAPSPKVRGCSRLLCQAALVMPDVPETVLLRMLDWLEMADPCTPALQAITANLAWVVANPFRSAAARVDPARLQAALDHPAIAVRCLAVDWLLVHEVPVTALPPAAWRSLLESSEPELQAASLRLLGGLPDSMLLLQAGLVARFCVSPAAAVRCDVGPLVLRLVAADAAFARGLLPTLLDAVFRAEPEEGLHDDVLQLLMGPLAAACRAEPVQTLQRLLEARSHAAQRLGAWLLEGLDASAVPLPLWVRLVRHEALTVRQRALAVVQEAAAELGLAGLLPALDSRWPDSRGPLLLCLQQQFAPDAWTLPQLVELCDHAHDDVQALGRELMAQRLAHGGDVAGLLALAQHPSLKVQRFVAEWLQQRLADDTEALLRLRPFFLTVLSQVNRGRAAKSAVFAFLQQQVAASETAAREVARLFEHLAVTVAIGDRARYVSGLYAIHRLYPHIDMMLAVQPPVVRGVV